MGEPVDARPSGNALLSATVENGGILGHENMGEVVELGSEVTNLKIGDGFVVPNTISCGQCRFCQRGLFSYCDRANWSGYGSQSAGKVARWLVRV